MPQKRDRPCAAIAIKSLTKNERGFCSPRGNWWNPPDKWSSNVGKKILRTGCSRQLCGRPSLAAIRLVRLERRPLLAIASVIAAARRIENAGHRRAVHVPPARAKHTRKQDKRDDGGNCAREPAAREPPRHALDWPPLQSHSRKPTRFANPELPNSQTK